MSDGHLRELERRWKETGAVEDETAWLNERLRIGDLTRERLELAAYCRTVDASPASDADSLASWVLGVGSVSGGLRAMAVAAASVCYECWLEAGADDPLFQRALTQMTNCIWTTDHSTEPLRRFLEIGSELVDQGLAERPRRAREKGFIPSELWAVAAFWSALYLLSGLRPRRYLPNLAVLAVTYTALAMGETSRATYYDPNAYDHEQPFSLDLHSPTGDACRRAQLAVVARLRRLARGYQREGVLPTPSSDETPAGPRRPAPGGDARGSPA